jgi:hypothetical protein
MTLRVKVHGHRVLSQETIAPHNYSKEQIKRQFYNRLGTYQYAQIL